MPLFWPLTFSPSMIPSCWRQLCECYGRDVVGMWTRLRRGSRTVGALLSVTLVVGITPVLGGEAVAGVPTAPRSAEAPTAAGGVSESDALAEAKRTGEPVEVSAQRGESREVFAMPEGHLEAR